MWKTVNFTIFKYAHSHLLPVSCVPATCFKQNFRPIFLTCLAKACKTRIRSLASHPKSIRPSSTFGEDRRRVSYIPEHFLRSCVHFYFYASWNFVCSLWNPLYQCTYYKWAWQDEGNHCTPSSQPSANIFPQIYMKEFPSIRKIEAFLSRSSQFS